MVASRQEQVDRLLAETARACADRQTELRDLILERVRATVPEFFADPDVAYDMEVAAGANVHRFRELLERPVAARGALALPHQAEDLLRTTLQHGIPLVALLEAYRGAQGLTAEWWQLRLEERAPAHLLARGTRRLGELLVAYIDAASVAVREAYEQERRALDTSTEGRRAHLIRKLLAGDPLDLDAAARTLRHPLDGRHVAAVLWRPDELPPADLSRGSLRAEDALPADRSRGSLRAEDAPPADPSRGSLRVEDAPPTARSHGSLRPVEPGPAAALPRALTQLTAAVGASHTLTLATPHRVYAWWTGPAPLDLEAASAVVLPPGVAAAISDEQPGAEGFARTHDHAVRTADAVRRRAGAPSRAARFEQLELVTLVGHDAEGSRRFVARVLGPLAADTRAAARSRATLTAYLAHGSSATRAARQLGVHRNTVMHRIAALQDDVPALRGHDGDRAAFAERRLELEVALRLVAPLSGPTAAA